MQVLPTVVNYNEDVLKLIFNHLELKDKSKMSIVSKEWFRMVNSTQAGETLLKKACLTPYDNTWRLAYKLFQKEFMSIIIVDNSNSMDIKIKTVIEKGEKGETVKKTSTRLAIANEKAIEIVKSLTAIMPKGMVFCGQFGDTCDLVQVTSVDEAVDYFKTSKVDRKITRMGPVYLKIHEVFTDRLAELEMQNCKLEINILSDFDCSPSDVKRFREFDVNFRYIRIDKAHESFAFQNRTIELKNLPAKEIENSIDDTVDISIDYDEDDNIQVKRKSNQKIEEEKEIPQTHLMFIEAESELPFRTLKKRKLDEASSQGTLWTKEDVPSSENRSQKI